MFLPESDKAEVYLWLKNNIQLRAPKKYAFPNKVKEFFAEKMNPFSNVFLLKCGHNYNNY